MTNTTNGKASLDMLERIETYETREDGTKFTTIEAASAEEALELAEQRYPRRTCVQERRRAIPTPVQKLPDGLAVGTLNTLRLFGARCA